MLTSVDASKLTEPVTSPVNAIDLTVCNFVAVAAFPVILVLFAMAFITKAFVAICVVLFPSAAVGAIGAPVNVGLVNIVALLSFVTLPKPTWVAVVECGLLVLPV